MQINDSDALREAIDLLIRCRNSAGRVNLELYNDIQEFIHKHTT